MDNKHDFEIPGANPLEGALSVSDLFDKLKKDFEPFRMQTLPRAELNERYFVGEQFLELGTSGIQASAWWDTMPRVSENLMRSLILTWASRILEDRPNVKAWPGDNGFGDASAVDMANSYLEYQRQLQDLDAMLSRAAIFAQEHSCVAFKICWDPDSGPEREFGKYDDDGLPIYNEQGEHECECIKLGEIKVILKTVFDYMIDPVEHVKDAQWVMFHSSISESEARHRLKMAGLDATDLSLSDVRKSYDESKSEDPKKKGVDAFELWHLPTDEIPDGLYAVMVDGHVTEAVKFPYKHGELPVAVWKINDRRDHPHGSTHVDDAIPVQRRINEGLATVNRLIRNVGQYVKAIVTSSIKDAWESDDQIIAIDVPEQAAIIRWLEPPMASVRFLQEQVRNDRESLYQVFGLSEMSTGVADVKSLSGKAVQYLKALDSQKLSHSARNLGEALRRINKQILQLAQQYMTDERMLAIAGPDGEPQVLAFRAANLAGVDVRLEPHSGLDLMRSTKSDKAMEQLQAGMITPPQAMEMQQYGTDGMRQDLIHREFAQEQIGMVLAGQFVQPDPNLDPKIAQEEIAQAIELYQADNPQMAWILYQLLNGYRMQGQQPPPRPEGQPGMGAPPQVPGGMNVPQQG